VETIGNRVRVWSRQPLKEQRKQRNRLWPVEGFLLLQTVFPAICNMGVEKRVADRANALSEAEEKQGRERKHDQKKTKSITQSEESPKG